MHSLDLLDLAVVIVYLAGITFIGARFYQRDASMRDYLLGGKAMKWIPVALSILAADTSAISYLGFPAWSFRSDMKLSQNALTYILAVPVVILVFLPVFSRFQLFTAYEYLERRFDLATRIAASVFFLLIRSAHAAIIIYAPALMMSELLNVPMGISILTMGLLTAVYTSLGGVKSVIWTDAIQVAAVIAGFGILTVSVLNNIPGGLSTVISVGAAHHKWTLLDLSFSLDRVDNFWAILIGGTFLSVQGMSTDQAVLQKYFTTGSARETSKALILYGALIVPLVMALSALGVILFVYYSAHPDLQATLKNADGVVPHYAAHKMPHGIAGIVIASIFAGSMSTVSASLNSMATSSVVDIYRRCLRPNCTDRHYMLASRWATAGWGAFATGFAFYAERLGALATAFAKVQSFAGGIILGIFLLGIVSKRANSRGALLGAATGLGVVVYTALSTSISMYWYCVIGCTATTSAGWILSIPFRKQADSIAAPTPR